MSKLEIGRMDRRITFQRPVYGSGQGQITGWQDIPTRPTVWCNLREKSGTEVFEGEQLVGVTSAEINIWYRDDLSIEYRGICEGKIWNIRAMKEEGRRRFLKLICESGGQYTT